MMHVAASPQPSSNRLKRRRTGQQADVDLTEDISQEDAGAAPMAVDQKAAALTLPGEVITYVLRAL